jgi:hypothetical protein
MANVSTKSKKTVNDKPKAATGKPPTGSPRVLGGICITCNYRVDCAHLKRNPNVTIWHCENYDDYVAPGETVPEVSITVVNNDVALGIETENATVEIKGLCIDCENRDGCAHAMKTGGVWHCEEYL